MKALHNSALSKLESWEVRIDCVTALTERVVTLTKGTMWRHRHESASAGAPPSRGRCTCAALCFLHRRTFYWETAVSSLLLRSTIGKLDSHAPQHETRCIRLSNDAVHFTLRLHNERGSTYYLYLLSIDKE